jgi:hypothetical protein
MVDETTDKKNRYVVNVLVGSLNGEKSKPMLIMTTFIDQTNKKTISQCIMDSLGIIWPKSIHYDRVCLIISDQASYMIKAMKNLKCFFPKLHHVTCLAHALHRVSLKVAEEHKEINSLISFFKKIMVKSPLREYQFQQKTGLSLPVKPVLTRWGTWLNAAFLLCRELRKNKRIYHRIGRF